MIETVSFIGAGKLAGALAPALKDKGIHVVEICSLSKSASELALITGSKVCEHPGDLVPVDLVLVAVNDSSIIEVVNQLPSGQAWAHTSGSVVLPENAGADCGVFYPLQTFSPNRRIDWPKVPICVESTSARLLESLISLGNLLSEKVVSMDSAQRKWLHLAAVFACNFSNALYAISEKLLQEHRLPFELLHPLILETAEKAVSHSPAKVQTGPAYRGDVPILERQEELLRDQEKLLHIYRLMTERIIHSRDEEL